MPTPTKICERCQQVKPATETYFGIHLRQKDGFKPYCRKCSPAVTAERRQRKNERSRQWAAANREKVRESYRRNYARNRQARIAYHRRYRQENKEKIAAYQQLYKERKQQEAP